jgi:hypothetical protein
VDAALAMGARIVWLPTVHSHQDSISTRTRWYSSTRPDGTPAWTGTARRAATGRRSRTGI